MEIRRLEVEKRNQKTAAGVAALLFLGVLVACFFITAFTISNPPPGQQFVAVGFADLGDVEQASGDVDSEAPSEIVEDAAEEAVAESVPEEAAVAETVVTQTESDVSVPAAEETVEDPQETEIPKPTISSSLSSRLSSLTSSGGGGSQGNAEEGVGNEGDELGKIDRNGVINGDDGSYLDGGNILGKPRLDEKPQIEGVIRVIIIVDKNGTVTSARYDPAFSTISDSDHIKLAERAAKTATFTPSPARPSRQGYVTIRFELE